MYELRESTHKLRAAFGSAGARSVSVAQCNRRRVNVIISSQKVGGSSKKLGDSVTHHHRIPTRRKLCCRQSRHNHILHPSPIPAAATAHPQPACNAKPSYTTYIMSSQGKVEEGAVVRAERSPTGMHQPLTAGSRLQTGNESLEVIDPELHDLIEQEKLRQWSGLELIASEVRRRWLCRHGHAAPFLRAKRWVVLRVCRTSHLAQSWSAWAPA